MAPGPSGRTSSSPTDTLWSIVVRSYAGDVREAIWELQQRNHLASSTITPGEKLVLPRGLGPLPGSPGRSIPET